MDSKYYIAIIGLLVVIIAILSYAAYKNDKKIKEMQNKIYDLENQKNVKQPGNPIAPRGSFYSSYTPTEVKNYYRDATIPERKWQKVGILTSGDKTMNLLARPSTYNEDIWQYRAEDRDGFIVEIGELQTVKTGQTIDSIQGKASSGPWTISLYKRDTFYF